MRLLTLVVKNEETRLPSILGDLSSMSGALRCVSVCYPSLRGTMAGENGQSFYQAQSLERRRISALEFPDQVAFSLSPASPSFLNQLMNSAWSPIVLVSAHAGISPMQPGDHYYLYSFLRDTPASRRSCRVPRHDFRLTLPQFNIVSEI